MKTASKSYAFRLKPYEQKKKDLARLAREYTKKLKRKVSINEALNLLIEKEIQTI